MRDNLPVCAHGVVKNTNKLRLNLHETQGECPGMKGSRKARFLHLKAVEPNVVAHPCRLTKKAAACARRVMRSF